MHATTGTIMKKILFLLFCTLSFSLSAQAWAPQNYCNGNIDCPGRSMCKNRGDGVRVCMDRGKQNDFCTSSIDCEGTRLFCKNRGDGLKVCMDRGKRNDYCENSIDCEGTLFCKDRGDHVKVCM